MFTPSLYSASSRSSKSHLISRTSTSSSTIYSNMSFDTSGCFNSANTRNSRSNYQQKDFYQDINDFSFFFKNSLDNIPNHFVRNEIIGDLFKINDNVKEYSSKSSMSQNTCQYEPSSIHRNYEQDSHINPKNHSNSDQFLEKIWSSVDLSQKKAETSDINHLKNNNAIINNSNTPSTLISMNDSSLSQIKFPRPITKSFKQKCFDKGKNKKFYNSNYLSKLKIKY
jgi:hypothetical protein